MFIFMKKLSKRLFGTKLVVEFKNTLRFFFYELWLKQHSRILSALVTLALIGAHLSYIQTIWKLFLEILGSQILRLNICQYIIMSMIIIFRGFLDTLVTLSFNVSGTLVTHSKFQTIWQSCFLDSRHSC